MGIRIPGRSIATIRVHPDGVYTMAARVTSCSASSPPLAISAAETNAIASSGDDSIEQAGYAGQHDGTARRIVDLPNKRHGFALQQVCLVEEEQTMAAGQPLQDPVHGT